MWYFITFITGGVIGFLVGKYLCSDWLDIEDHWTE